MRLTEERLEIFKQELCSECLDAPMDGCLCGCMRKAIYNALEEAYGNQNAAHKEGASCI